MGKTFKEQSFGQFDGHRINHKSGKRQKNLVRKINHSANANGYENDNDYQIDYNHKDKR